MAASFWVNNHAVRDVFLVMYMCGGWYGLSTVLIIPGLSYVAQSISDLSRKTLGLSKASNF